jgi:release factor glutamine methyltransferase
VADEARRPQDLKQVLRAACVRLRAAGCEDARLEAEMLLAHVLGCKRSQLIVGAGAPSAEQVEQLERLLQRRIAGEPVAYLEGSRGFWGLEFQVDARVLIPRADSETLVERAVNAIQDRACRVLDLGTGSGALLLSVLHSCPRASGIGVDRSWQALQVASANAAQLGLAQRARFVQASWSQSCAPASIEIVLCNPPYIEPNEELGPGVLEHEPAVALFSPPGRPFAAYEEVLNDLPRILCRSAQVFFEVGRGRAAGLVRRCAETGLTQQKITRDLGGIERVVEARWESGILN